MNKNVTKYKFIFIMKYQSDISLMTFNQPPFYETVLCKQYK